MRRVILCILLLWLLAITKFSVAQSVAMNHYTIENGLPSNTLYGIVRDSKGFLWFCTDKGVCRYNGLRFQYFNFRDGIPDNEVFSAVEDKSGRLWFNTFNGELCFYQDGVFHNAQNTPYLKLPFKMPYIMGIRPHADSSVSFLFHNETRFVTISKNQYHIHDMRPFLPEGFSPVILQLTKLSGSVYEVQLSDRSITFDTSGHVIRRDTFSGNRYRVAGPQFWLWDSTGIYGEDGQLQYRFEKSKNVLPHLYFFVKEGAQSLLGTKYGLILNDSINVLPGASCSTVAKDINGDYWIGTLKHGAYRIQSGFAEPVVYNNIVPDRIVYAAASNGQLLLITQNNEVYGLKNGQASLLLQIPGGVGKTTESIYYSDGRQHFVLRGEDAFVLHQRSDGRMMMQQYRLLVPHVPQWKTAIRTGHRIFLHSPNDIYIWDYDPVQQHNSNSTLRKLKGHPGNQRIFSMAKDANGTIWYSTLSHIYKVTNDSAVVQPRMGEMGFRWMSINGPYLTGITHRNELLVCAGLDTTPLIDTLAQEDFVWSKPFMVDDSGFIFTANHTYSLLRLHPFSGKPNYTLQVIDHPFVPADAQFVCQDEQYYYFIKHNSVFRTSRQRFLQHAPQPSLFFTGLYSDGKLLYSRFAADTTISIPYRFSRNLKISFAVLSFYNKEVGYEYALSSGETDHWIPIQGEEINLLMPDYGHYTLKLRVRNHAGDYSTPQRLHLQILAPFWVQPWFIFLVVLIFAGLLFLIVRTTLRRMIRKKEQQHHTEIRLLKSEYKALNALMNPHFIFNSLNNIQGLINENDKLGANQYLNDFSMLVRQNMQNTAHELIPLQKEITLVQHYLRLEKLRFKDHLHYQLDISESVDADLVMVPPLMIQPLVENAIKHGLLVRPSVNNKVTVKISETDEAVYIEVEDNGVGFRPKVNNGMHESIGLKTLKQRIEHLRRISDREVFFDIQSPVNEQEQSGTRVTITINH